MRWKRLARSAVCLQLSRADWRPDKRRERDERNLRRLANRIAEQRMKIASVKQFSWFESATDVNDWIKLTQPVQSFKCLNGLAPAYLADDCVPPADAPEIYQYPETCALENKNGTRRQRLGSLLRRHLEFSAGRLPNFLVDCCNVCQALKTYLFDCSN